MKPARVLAPLIAITLAGTLSACGDDDDNATSDSLSRTELIAAGDAICTETSNKNRPLEATFTDDGPPPLDRWAEFWPQLADNEEAAVAEMRQLQPSAEDEADFTAVVDAYAELIPLFRAAGEKAAADDQAGHDAAMAEIEEASQPVEAGFTRLGFEECGSNDDE